MGNQLRETGIRVLRRAPWGTHFCLFYRNKKDLCEILVPYFKAGLENNELCVWVCVEQLGVGEAQAALRKAVPRLGAYVKRGQIEFYSHKDWFQGSGKFNPKKVLRAWSDRRDRALDAGYDGLRVTADVFWLSAKDKAPYVDYQAGMNDLILRSPMLSLSTCSQENCDTSGIIDAVNHHKFSLVRQDGKWTVAESTAGRSRILEGVFASSVFPLAVLDKNFNFVRVNEAYAEACQRDISEFPGRNYFDFFPHKKTEAIFKRVVKTATPSKALAMPIQYPDHPDRGISYWDWTLSPVLDKAGAVEFLVYSLKDVTATTRVLDQLRQQEEMLRKVLETLPVGIWLVDRSGRIMEGNPSAHKIWGGGRRVGIDEYGLYKGWWVDSGKEITPGEWASARAIRKGETSLNEEIEIQSFDGKRKIILNSAIPIRDANKKISGAIIVNQDITDRRKAESKLREQAALLDLANEAIYECDLSHRILFWNRGAERLYGWRKGEVLGKISHKVLRSKFVESLPEIMEKIIREGRWEGEYSQISRHGMPLVISGRWALKRDSRGRPSGILKINFNATERKKTEETVRAASVYTRNLIEASLDPLVTISSEGKITDVNKATELVTGADRADLIGSDFSNYFTDPAKAREGYQRAFSTGSVRDYPLAIRRASGEVTDVLYNATVFRNEAGEVQGVFAAARDITGQKKAEEESLRLVKALEQATEGIVIMNPDREILYVNKGFERLNGVRSPDVLHKTYDAFLRATGKEEELESEIEETLNRRERWQGRVTRHKGDGSLCELDVIISPVTDETGGLKSYVAVERDVTEEVKLQTHVRQRQKMEALGTLAGGIAHDFNNILMPILVNAEMALMDEPEESPVSRQLKLVLEAANRGKDLVKQIIAFSRQKDQEKAPVGVSPVLREALKFLRASIPRNIEILDHIGAESAMVLGDATQLHQVLMNLCSNAAHAMRGKGGILAVQLAETDVDAELSRRYLDLRPGRYLKLTVDDTGDGIAPENIDKIFDPFFTTKAPGEGTGMGLAVVHGIVKNLGGAVTVYSEVGKGSSFSVYLPVIQDGGKPREVVQEPLPLVSAKILFVDDEEIQVQTLVPMLKRLGYDVVGSTDARKALELFRTRPEDFDLVITDQTMPSMAGDQFMARLKKIRPDIPVILYTGFSETISEEQAKSRGVAAFLMKPVSVKEIQDTIRRVLRSGSRE